VLNETKSFKYKFLLCEEPQDEVRNRINTKIDDRVTMEYK
jgi:hypothetical protein